MFDAINSVVDKVEKQARRAHKKFLDKRRRAQHDAGGVAHWPMEVLAADSLADSGGPRVVKTVRLPIETMTLEQASLALEDAKNEFFVFLNSKSQQVNVLYRRQDENFGLIVPEL
jgi:putative sigma-54 modulation protein